MLNGLWRLTWLEIKIFVREPMGVIGSIGIPVLMFVLFARLFGPRVRLNPNTPRFVGADLPIFVSVLIATGTVLSLIAVIAIYREGGILKRLRATPLRPHTILAAHVLVKLLSTALTLGLMLLAGRRYYPVGTDVPVWSFTLALLVSTASIVSFGFVVASVVPTARFAQPIGTLVVYPMLALSGLFFPIDVLPPAAQAVARILPLTYAVSLLRGIWHGEGWLPHASDIAAMALMCAVLTAISTRMFRWE